MTLKSAPYYWVECDEPDGCESTEGGEYAAWGDAGYAVDEAINSDWIVTDDGKHYCETHVPRCPQCGNMLETDGTCEDQDEHNKEAERPTLDIDDEQGPPSE